MPIDRDFALLLKSDQFGDGEPDLGARLIASFLNVLLESGRLPARIVCLNSGVFLTTEGSPVADTLRVYEKYGTEVISCSTCLEYYGRKDKLIVGKPTDMKTIVATLREFKTLTV